jgi:archaellum component FlaF (FlaF/FlaG flagellin family)
MKQHRLGATLGKTVLLLLLSLVPTAALTATTERASVDSSGIQGNRNSGNPSISADGRYVAFDSAATNLVPGDTNGLVDVFVHDRQTGRTTRVSVDSKEIQGNNASWEPSISADGRYVAFDSAATNLVPGDTNYVVDVFVHDRQTGQTTRVSVDSNGIQANQESVGLVGISADGRYVAFDSYATNLVPGDTNDLVDVFVHDSPSVTSAIAPVYRFWSDVYGHHFYTISEAEKNYVIATWPDRWRYEGPVYYAYPSP